MLGYPSVTLVRRYDRTAIKDFHGHTHDIFDLLIEALVDLLDNNRAPDARDGQIAEMVYNAVLQDLVERREERKEGTICATSTDIPASFGV